MENDERTSYLYAPSLYIFLPFREKVYSWLSYRGFAYFSPVVLLEVAFFGIVAASGIVPTIGIVPPSGIVATSGPLVMVLESEETR